MMLPMETSELLSQRGKTHGNYSDHARLTQSLKEIMRNFHCIKPSTDNTICSWDELQQTQAEALDMIAHKIGRILAGDPDFRDHWDDIAGYAKLVADRCTK